MQLKVQRTEIFVGFNSKTLVKVQRTEICRCAAP